MKTSSNNMRRLHVLVAINLYLVLIIMGLSVQTWDILTIGLFIFLFIGTSIFIFLVYRLFAIPTEKKPKDNTFTFHGDIITPDPDDFIQQLKKRNSRNGK